MPAIPLCDVVTQTLHTIQKVVSLSDTDLVSQRLRELGFIPGSPIQIIATTPFKAGPIAVKVGQTRFALRRSEAARIFVLQQPL